MTTRSEGSAEIGPPPYLALKPPLTASRSAAEAMSGNPSCVRVSVMTRPAGFEPATSRSGGARSIH